MPCYQPESHGDDQIGREKARHARKRRRLGLEESPNLPYEVLDGKMTVAAFKHESDARRFTENSDLRIVRCPRFHVSSDRIPAYPISEPRPIEPVLPHLFKPRRKILGRDRG